MTISKISFPGARDSDHEDVHCSLTVAASTWARGDVGEALRWLRRAAEQAADADDDIRALELYNVASDVAAVSAAPRTVEPARARRSSGSYRVPPPLPSQPSGPRPAAYPPVVTRLPATPAQQPAVAPSLPESNTLQRPLSPAPVVSASSEPIPLVAPALGIKPVATVPRPSPCVSRPRRPYAARKSSSAAVRNAAASMELPETQRYCDLDEATVPRAEVIVGAATDSRELVNTDVRAPVADVPSAYLDDDPRAAMTSTRVAVHWNAQTNAVELSVLELGQSPAPGTVAAILVPVSETCALDLARVLSGQTA